MFKSMRRKYFCMALATASLSLLADSVMTKDGSIIKGKIVKIHSGNMTVQTKYSDDIILKMDMIESFKTDGDVRVKTATGEEFEGTVDSSEKSVNISSAKTQSKVNDGKITTLWMPGDISPDYVEPFQKEWKVTLGADWLKKTGNTDEQSMAAEVVAILEDEKDITKLYARYRWRETEKVETDDEIIAGADYERQINDRSSWYIRGEVESDEFELIDLRTTIAGGYGYYFKKQEHLKLRGRIGMFSRYESYTVDIDNYDSYGLDLGLFFDYIRPDKFGWYTDLNYTPSIQNFSEFRLTHESALRLPIGDSNWSFKLGIRQEYNSEAAETASKLDNTYFSRLELNF